jgi:hypothetical protein
VERQSAFGVVVLSEATRKIGGLAHVGVALGARSTVPGVKKRKSGLGHVTMAFATARAPIWCKWTRSGQSSLQLLPAMDVRRGAQLCCGSPICGATLGHRIGTRGRL